MSKEHSAFYRWFNSSFGKRFISAFFSAGASVVILGALFKILHLPGANYMLIAGMTTEAIIFFIGIFETPHKDYDWDRIFDFGSESPQKANLASSGSTGVPNLNITESFSDGDVKSINEGIKKLSKSAEELQSLTKVAKAAEGLTENIESASIAATKYTEGQAKINAATDKLALTYQNAIPGIETAVDGTKAYSEKVSEINKSLSSINSIYEIQLKHIQAQNEGLSKQAESIKNVAGQLDGISSYMNKIKDTAMNSIEETQKYQAATQKLTKQIEDLNKVYGNMLNALN